MSLNTFKSENGTLADRLNRRRRLRQKHGLDRTAGDEADVTSLRGSQTSRQRADQHSAFTSLGSSAPVLNQDNTPAKDTHAKENYLFIDHGADFTSRSERRRSQSLEPIRERESSAKSSPTAEQQTHPDQLSAFVISKESAAPVTAEEAIAAVIVEEKVSPVVDRESTSPVIIKETVPLTDSPQAVNVSPPAQEEKLDDSHSDQDEEPVTARKISSPKLLPVASSRSKKMHPTIELRLGAKSHSYDSEESEMTRKFSSPKLPPVASPRMKNIHPTTKLQLDTKSHSFEDVEPLSPKLPPLVPPRTSRKPQLPQPLAVERPVLNRINDLSRTSLDCPSSDPPRMADREQRHFDFPLTEPMPIVRSTSEQVVSTTRHRHQSTDPKFAKQNSLALSYVFSKRIIAAEFTSGSSLDAEQSRHRTVWD